MKVYEPPAVYVDHMKRWRRPNQPLTRWQWWMIALAGGVLGWLLSGCSVRSQEIAVVGAAGADLVSTELALERGGVEANPLMENRTARVLGKTAATATVLLLARELEDEHPRAAAIMRMSIVGLWAGAALWNVSVSW